MGNILLHANTTQEQPSTEDKLSHLLLQSFMILVAQQTTRTPQTRYHGADIGCGYVPLQATMQNIEDVDHGGGQAVQQVLVDPNCLPCVLHHKEALQNHIEPGNNLQKLAKTSTPEGLCGPQKQLRINRAQALSWSASKTHSPSPHQYDHSTKTPNQNLLNMTTIL
jgi:hypothetical protein